jgi:hypothetical protein
VSGCEMQEERQVKKKDKAFVKERSWPPQKKHDINILNISD